MSDKPLPPSPKSRQKAMKTLGIGSKDSDARRRSWSPHKRKKSGAAAVETREPILRTRPDHLRGVSASAIGTAEMRFRASGKCLPSSAGWTHVLCWERGRWGTIEEEHVEGNVGCDFRASSSSSSPSTTPTPARLATIPISQFHHGIHYNGLHQGQKEKEDGFQHKHRYKPRAKGDNSETDILFAQCRLQPIHSANLRSQHPQSDPRPLGRPRSHRRAPQPILYTSPSIRVRHISSRTAVVLSTGLHAPLVSDSGTSRSHRSRAPCSDRCRMVRPRISGRSTM
jgi:hypothetical protein